MYHRPHCGLLVATHRLVRIGGRPRGAARGAQKWPPFPAHRMGRLMPLSPEAMNQAVQKYRAYLATLTAIHVDPRLRAKFGLSDVVQNTLLEAFRQVERIEA